MTTIAKKSLVIGLLAGIFLGHAQAATTYYLRVAAPGVVAPLLAPALDAWSIPGKTFGDADFALNTPSSSSPGAISYSSSNPSVASVSGNVVRILHAGTVTITATQAAAQGFLEGSVTGTLQIAQASPNIATWSIPAQTYGAADFSLTAPTSTSSGAFTYASSDPTIASVTGTLVHIVKAGTVNITATQAATTDYRAGQSTAQFVVNPPAGPSLVGDGVSYAGACSTGISGCATFDPVTGYELNKVSFLNGNLSLLRQSASSPEVHFTKNPTSGKYYFEMTIGTVNTGTSLFSGSGYLRLAAGNYSVKLDYDLKKVTISGPTSGSFNMNGAFVAVQLYDNVTANFGQSAFRNPVPAGYHAGIY